MTDVKNLAGILMQKLILRGD